MRLLLFCILVAQAVAQPLELQQLKQIWPWIEVTYRASCSDSVRVFENGIEKFPFFKNCPDSVRCAMSITLVIDRSGSMDGLPLDEAKRAAIEFISNMDTLDEAAIVVFNQEAVLAEPMTRDKTVLITAINDIYAIGGTALWEGAFAGVMTSIAGKNPCKAVVVLSDGISTSDFFFTLADVIGFANANQMPVFTIGLGSSADSTGLSQLATATGAKYYQTLRPQDLVDIYGKILSQVTAPFCLLKYETECPDGSVRNVTLIACGDTVSRTYTAHYDSSVYRAIYVILRDTIAKDTVRIPIILSDSVSLKNAWFDIVSCGTITPYVVGNVSTIPGGVRVRVDSLFTNYLGEIVIKLPDRDSSCTLWIRWGTEGCISAISGTSQITTLQRKPFIHCVITAVRDSVFFSLINRGDTAYNARVWTGTALIPIGNFVGIQTLLWIGKDSVCAMGIFDNHSTVECCTRVIIPADSEKNTVSPDLFCDIICPDTVDTLFSFRLRVWTDTLSIPVRASIISTSHFTVIGYGEFQRQSDFETTFWMNPVKEGWAKIRVLVNNKICEKDVYVRKKHIRFTLDCDGADSVHIDSLYTVRLSLKNYADSVYGMVQLLGSTRFSSEFQRGFGLGDSIQIDFQDRPFRVGTDTLIFYANGEQCQVVVRVYDTEPDFRLSCQLKKDSLFATISNLGGKEGTKEVFLSIPPGITADYPLQLVRIASGNDTTIAWKIRFSYGTHRLVVQAGKLSCIIDTTILDHRRTKSLTCWGPDTVWPGEITLYAAIDSEFVLLTSPQHSVDHWVSDTGQWLVPISKTTTFRFYADGLVCETKVYVREVSSKLSCSLSVVGDTVVTRFTNSGQSGIKDYTYLYADSAEIQGSQPLSIDLLPGESVELRWVLRPLPTPIDRFLTITAFTYLTQCQLEFFQKGERQYFKIELPTLVGQYGDKFTIPIQTFPRGFLSTIISFDPSVVSFLYGGILINDSSVFVSSAFPVLYFEGISRNLRFSPLVASQAEMGDRSPIYEQGGIWVSGDCLTPLRLSSEILYFDLLGRKVDFPTKGWFLKLENGVVSKIYRQ